LGLAWKLYNLLKAMGGMVIGKNLDVDLNLHITLLVEIPSR
jgi:hypothetical protein